MNPTNATVDDIEVDEIDYDLNNLKWHVNPSSVLHSTYDAKTQHTGKEKLHRIIMSRMLSRALGSIEGVDHIDGNWRNNHRSNLRLVTHQQNRRNNRAYRGSSSRFVGVAKVGTHWVANITFMYRTYYIGYFASELEAAWMRDQWTLALFGEYGHLNLEYSPSSPKAA